MARTSIHTKFICPTDTRGSRYKASADGRSVTIGADNALSPEDNHEAAARALIDKMGWKGKWAVGVSDDGYVFVNVVDSFEV